MKEKERKIKWLDQITSIPEKPDFEVILKAHYRHRQKRKMLMLSFIFISMLLIVTLFLFSSIKNELSEQGIEVHDRIEVVSDSLQKEEVKREFPKQDFQYLEPVGSDFLKRYFNQTPKFRLKEVIPFPTSDTLFTWSRPAFPKVGFDSLNNYFGFHINGLKQEVNGDVTIYLFFDVNIDGTTSNLAIQGVKDSILIEDLNKMVDQMPPWWPAIKEGKLVKSRFKVPLQIIEIDSTRGN